MYIISIFSSSDKNPTCQCRRCKRGGRDPWVGEIPWRKKRQPTPVFLPEESHEPDGSDCKESACMPETQVQSLAWEDPLEKEVATHSSILSWEIPWTEEPGGLQSMGSQRVRHNRVSRHHMASLWKRRGSPDCWPQITGRHVQWSPVPASPHCSMMLTCDGSYFCLILWWILSPLNAS